MYYDPDAPEPVRQAQIRNGYLLQAAPDLLEACKAAERALQCHIGKECLADHFPLKLEILRAAIAKTEGGQS